MSSTKDWRTLSTRELSYSSQRRIAAFLDAPNSLLNWKDLLSKMSEYGPLQMQQLSNEQSKGKSPTLALLQHMSSSGRNVGDLYEYCNELGMKGVCELIIQGLKDRGILVDIVNSPSQSNATVNTTNNQTNAAKTPNFNPSPLLPSAPPLTLNLGSTCSVSYDEVFKATGQFDEMLYKDGGHKLGEGGFGKVFYCQIDISGTKKEIAVKVLSDQGDPEMRVQFQTELNTITKLNHPHLLPLLAYSTNDTSLCLLYPYMALGSLDKHLQSLELSGQQRVKILQDITSALHYLHSCCTAILVHRDVKSANILLDQNWRGILTDFGVARTLSYGTTTAATQRIVGTRVYMAPEYCTGLVSPAADVYSLGIVILEMIFGWLANAGPDGSNTDMLSYLDDFEGDTSELYLSCWLKDEGIRLEKLAERCTDPNRYHRPTTADVLQVL